MANLRRARRQLQSVAIALGVICAIAAGLLLFVALRSGSTQTAQFEDVHRRVQKMKASVIPPDTVQQRVDEASKQIDAFYKNRFPAEASAIYTELGRVATQNNVRMGEARYKAEDADIPGLQKVTIEATLLGGYVQNMKFINALERDKMLFLVDGVKLAGEAQSNGQVRLSVLVETYLRS